MIFLYFCRLVWICVDSYWLFVRLCWFYVCSWWFQFCVELPISTRIDIIIIFADFMLVDVDLGFGSPFVYRLLTSCLHFVLINVDFVLIFLDYWLLLIIAMIFLPQIFRTFVLTCVDFSSGTSWFSVDSWWFWFYVELHKVYYIDTKSTEHTWVEFPWHNISPTMISS